MAGVLVGGGGSVEELVEGVLGDREIWGEDLTEVAGLVAMVSRYLGVIEREGVEGLLRVSKKGKRSKVPS